MIRFGLLLMGLVCGIVFAEPVSSARLEPAPNALQRYTFQHPQMGTVFRLVFYASKDSTAAASMAQQVFNRIDTLNSIFSDWLPDSELNRLCKSAGSGMIMPVSPELFDIIVQSKNFARKSAGAFDITVGPLTRLWRRARSLKEIPSDERIAEARNKLGWNDIETFPQNHGIRLKKAGMALDLGGIAQGWTADDCLKILRNSGITRALVDAGGDIALGDSPPGEKGWEIEIPALGGKNLLFLANCGITTSGATYRYLELDGKRYSHIIDPRTGMALTHHTLVTVKAPNATIADAWATAVSVSGEAGRKKALNGSQKLEVWLTETPF